MLEMYAFFAAFTAQIVALSVLCPTRLIRAARAQMTSYPAERFPQLYPRGSSGFDRTLTLYRALNTGVAVLGFLLLGWLFSYMRRPDWDDGPVEFLVTVYFVAQALPLCLAAWTAVEFNKALKSALPDEKRKAILQRRGLFDFVSPSIVFLALLSYFLFVAFVIYIERDPFPGFAGYLINIGVVTLLYAVMAFCVYATLYGKKSNPLETHADRMRTIGLIVKVCVYSCIGCVVFLSLNFTLVLLDLQRWEPFAQSVSLLICALLCFMVLSASSRQPGADVLGSSGGRNSAI
jgi:hypothetical protein